jgi:hypothetical protein
VNLYTATAAASSYLMAFGNTGSNSLRAFGNIAINSKQSKQPPKI